MTATVHEATAQIASQDPAIVLAYAGAYHGYYAGCTACNWISDTFHAVGLESAPNAAALSDAVAHNYRHHRTTNRKDTTS